MSYNTRLLLVWCAVMLVTIPASYFMAWIGEPRAHWIWCTILGAC